MKYETIASGNWNDPKVWKDGKGPPIREYLRKLED